MPRTPLYAALRRIANQTDRAHRTAPSQPRAISRRAVLAGVGAAALPVLPARAASGLRVAVVGAGLAGLTAARRLRQAGVRATLFEGNTRLGGRCWTVRGVFADGQLAEHGGEFIDTDHRPIRALVAELGLHLDDVLAAQPDGAQALYYLDGQPYSEADAARDYLPVYPIVQKQNAALGNVSYRNPTPVAVALDAITVAEWVARHVPGGRTSRFGRLLENAVAEELAADTTRLSAINVPFLFAADPRRHFDLYYTGSDQRFHVRGGNDQIVQLLADGLAGQIETATALNAVTRLPDGSLRLGFSRDSVALERVFDRVILALPFSVMRDAVDYAHAGFRPLKQRAIQRLGMGHSVKFQLQFSRRVWDDLGCTGEIRLDSPLFQTSWDVTRAQPGGQGVLNFWSGGTQADRSGALDARSLAGRCFADAAPLLPGLQQAWTGRMTRDAWAYNPWSFGSYAYPPLGYMTHIMGIEPEPEGNCFFAGEHTYVQQTGYLNAGVASGEIAARQLLASLPA